MSLSKGQKYQLETAASWVNDEVELHVIIGNYIPYTREYGSGYPVVVKMFYTSEPQCYDLTQSMSRCQHRYTAFDKAREIARYLVDELGVDKSRVTIKSRIGVQS